LLGRIDTHPFTGFSHPFKLDDAINLGKDGVVTSHAHIRSGMDPGSELADDDIPSSRVLTAVEFHTTPLAWTIASIPA
jgi:hypothetical protein